MRRCMKLRSSCGLASMTSASGSHAVFLWLIPTARCKQSQSDCNSETSRQHLGDSYLYSANLADTSSLALSISRPEYSPGANVDFAPHMKDSDCTSIQGSCCNKIEAIVSVQAEHVLHL